MTRYALAAVALVLAAPGLATAATPPGTDPLAYPGPAWSPYLVGALIGVLSMATFYFSNKPLGASTAYARLAGMVGKLFARRHTESLKYYQDFKPRVDWEVMLVVGVVGGALLAAWLGGELTGEWLPGMWTARFGADSLGLRLAVAFAGGGLMAFGARMAGGCTSGHGISGALQLSVGSWIAVVCFFAAGIATAMLMFRV
jgi:uncharacterized membrane protein YedE/YeeE